MLPRLPTLRESVRRTASRRNRHPISLEQLSSCRWRVWPVRRPWLSCASMNASSRRVRQRFASSNANSMSLPEPPLRQKHMARVGRWPQSTSRCSTSRGRTAAAAAAGGERGHHSQLEVKRDRARKVWTYINMIMGGVQGAIRWFFHELQRSMSSSRVHHEHQLLRGQVDFCFSHASRVS